MSIFFRYLHIMVIFGMVVFIVGCDQSQTAEERKAQEEADRKTQIQKIQKEKRLKIEEIERKYDAVYFPPENIGKNSFTFEIQRFFLTHAKVPIFFKGYLEDIEKTEDGIIIEFLSPLVPSSIGGDYFSSEAAVRFRLIIQENKVEQFLKGKRGNSMLRSVFRSLRINVPNYFVVAQIENIRKIRKYQVDGSSRGEEVEIETETTKDIVSTGHFIEAIIIPKQ